jgi:hypothetical protein
VSRAFRPCRAGIHGSWRGLPAASRGITREGLLPWLQTRPDRREPIDCAARLCVINRTSCSFTTNGLLWLRSGDALLCVLGT